ncbi:hypothetical protein [Caldifermentibacillus hisashii]|uniref:hypothetical protein n=1 Tax=Caldifermentibacillus hisashii TaxID=996558 RepID=UPI003D1A8FE4
MKKIYHEISAEDIVVPYTGNEESNNLKSWKNKGEWISPTKTGNIVVSTKRWLLMDA